MREGQPLSQDGVNNAFRRQVLHKTVIQQSMKIEYSGLSGLSSVPMSPVTHRLLTISTSLVAHQRAERTVECSYTQTDVLRPGPHPSVDLSVASVDPAFC